LLLPLLVRRVWFLHFPVLVVRGWREATGWSSSARRVAASHHLIGRNTAVAKLWIIFTTVRSVLSATILESTSRLPIILPNSRSKLRLATGPEASLDSRSRPPSLLRRFDSCHTAISMLRAALCRLCGSRSSRR